MEFYPFADDARTYSKPLIEINRIKAMSYFYIYIKEKLLKFEKEIKHYF